jgi:hypothetical protein
MPLPAIVASNLLALGALSPTGPSPAPGGAPPAGGHAARTLTFAMQSQQQLNWCWAAVAVSVAQFYLPASPWSQQCDVAGHELTKSCCPPGSNAACDIPWYLDLALQRVGHLNTWAAGPVPAATIQGEIDADRPLGTRIAWNTGGGHFVVLSGYSSPAAGHFVTVEDPFWGQSILPLAMFQTAYQGTGSWSHAYLTQP